MNNRAFLVLQNGQAFEGCRFGAQGVPTGELVFTTGMTGYIETLSDPGYYGQIVMQTYPLIGNYGMIPEDMESGRCHMKGYVVRDWCAEPSNFRSNGTIDEFLKTYGIPGIYGVDTRAITCIICEAGVMNGRIVDEVTPEAITGLADYAIRGAAAAAGGKEEQLFAPKGEKRFRVALIDYGAKSSIVRALCERGCEVINLPYDTTAAHVLALNPDGIVLSNGPGDPAENTKSIKEIKELMGRVPVFGIGLGHQLLALAAGGRTQKLKCGHRGANQPVKDIMSGRVYITSQNHGYTVLQDSLAHCGARVRMLNANDGTCEGLDYPELRAFSAQFHPEASAWAWDTGTLFSRFTDLMEGNTHAFK